MSLSTLLLSSASGSHTDGVTRRWGCTQFCACVLPVVMRRVNSTRPHCCTVPHMCPSRRSITEVHWAARGPTRRTRAGGARRPGQLAKACQSAGDVVAASCASPGPLVSSPASPPVRRGGTEGLARGVRAFLPERTRACFSCVLITRFLSVVCCGDVYLCAFSSRCLSCFCFNVVESVAFVYRKPLLPQGFEHVFLY